MRVREPEAGCPLSFPIPGNCTQLIGVGPVITFRWNLRGDREEAVSGSFGNFPEPVAGCPVGQSLAEAR